MPDMNENAETQQEYFGKVRTDNTKTLYNALNKIAELEKHIEELQEENGKLLQKIEQLKKDVIENESDCSMCDFPKLKQDLEKENAELNNFIMQSKKDGISPINALIIKNLGNQLIKAKDLLKQWLQTSKASGCDNINIVTDTEQFLSEVEK